MTSLMDPNPEGSPAWVKFVATIGVPSTIALFLVWVTTSTFASAQKAQGEKLQEIQTLLEQHHQDDRQRAETSNRDTREVAHYLRIMCLTISRTADDRRACVDFK